MNQKDDRVTVFKHMFDGWELAVVSPGKLGEAVAICELEFRKPGHRAQRILATFSAEASPDFHAYLGQHLAGGAP